MLALSLATLLAASTASDTPVVSVLYFENASNDAELEALKKGLADLIITDLVAWEGVRVVERTRLEDVLKELDFQQTKYVDKASAAKLGKVIGATYLVYGSMVASGKTLVLTARLVRASDGEALLSIKEQDERDKIFDLEQRLVNQLVAQIDAKLSANAMARRLAAKLAEISGLQLLFPVEANGVFLTMPPAFVEAMHARGWHFYKFIGDDGHRLMCSWQTTEAAVDEFIADARACAPAT